MQTKSKESVEEMNVQLQTEAEAKAYAEAQGAITSYAELQTELHEEWRELCSLTNRLQSAELWPRCFGVAIYLKSSIPEATEIVEFSDATGNNELINNDSLSVMVMNELSPSRRAGISARSVRHTTVTQFKLIHGAICLDTFSPQMSWDHWLMPYDKLCREGNLTKANTPCLATLNCRENSREFAIANRVLRTMLTYGRNFSAKWKSRYVDEPAPKLFYGSDSTAVSPGEDFRFPEAFPEAYVSLAEDVTTADILKHSCCNGSDLNTAASPLTQAFINSLESGLPVVSNVAGTYVGKVEAPDDATDLEKKLCMFHAIQTAEVRGVRIGVTIPVLRSSGSVHIKVGDEVRVGDEIGFVRQAMPNFWKRLHSSLAKYNTLEGYTITADIRDMLLGHWLDRQYIYADGKRFLKYSLVASAVTHPGYPGKITGIWWRMNDKVDCWNDTIDGYVLPAVPQHRWENFARPVDEVYLNFQSHDKRFKV